MARSGTERGYVTVNGCAAAFLRKRVCHYLEAMTTYYYWEVGGEQVFRSATADEARAKMDRALQDGVIF